MNTITLKITKKNLEIEVPINNRSINFLKVNRK